MFLGPPSLISPGLSASEVSFLLLRFLVLTSTSSLRLHMRTVNEWHDVSLSPVDSEER